MNRKQQKAMPIGLRLGLGFAAVLSLMAIVTASGVYKIDAVRGNLEEVKRLSQEVSAASAMRNSVQDMSISLRDSVLSESDDLFNLAKSESLKHSDAYEMASKELEKLKVNSEGVSKSEADAIGKIVEMRAYAQPLIDQVFEIRATGDIVQARDLLVYETSTAMAMWWASLSDYIKEKEGRLVKATAEANSESNELLFLIIGMSIVALISGMIIATIITKKLLKELGAEPANVKELAEAIGRGEFFSVDAVGKVPDASIMRSLVEMANQLKAIVHSVRESADAVAQSSEQLLAGNMEISSRTEDQAAAITETAAAMEQLGGTVKQNTENASHADDLAHKASAVAVKGGEAMGEVVVTMRDINKSTKEISEIVAVIDSIAFQTNLLALNASVEAARAGDQGRGFAVVASEVRGLAQRSAKASQDIRNLISQNGERVKKGTSLVENAGKTTEEIVESITKVSHLMSEISNASREQSIGVDDVGKAITQMDQATQTNGSIVDKNQEAAKNLKAKAVELQEVMQRFKLERGA